MAKRGRSGISPVQQDYLALLRSALWGTEPGPLPNDIPGVMHIADLQKTRPLIISALQKAGYKSDDPAISGLILNNAATHLKTNHIIAIVVSALRESGINPVLLKGQGLAQNYPEPMLRECGDIDLYVGKEKYNQACEIIDRLATHSYRMYEYEDPRHYHTNIQGIVIEIHRLGEEFHDNKIDDIAQHITEKGLTQELVPIVIDNVSVDTPADNYNAFYLFQHIWRHFLNSGVGLRQLCDWILFLHSSAGKINQSVIKQWISKLHLEIPWTVFGSIAVDYLGLPAADMPLYNSKYNKSASNILSLILADGNFGFGQPCTEERPSNYLGGKIYSVKRIIKRPSTIWRLFPEMRPLIMRMVVRELGRGIIHTLSEAFRQKNRTF